MHDPRNTQILLLLLFFFFGKFFLDFDISLNQIFFTFLGALSTQFFINSKKIKSSFITASSLCLLLRSSSIWISLLAGSLAILSKYFIRKNGTHIFNPAAFSIFLFTSFTEFSWVSSGQWGSTIYYLIFACSGSLFVLVPSRSWKIGFFFLTSYWTLLFIRMIYLNDGLEIFMNQIQNGALLLFALFMITDPVTSPKTNSGQMVYSFCLSILCYISVFHFYSPKYFFPALLISNLTFTLLKEIPLHKTQKGAYAP